jgi:hypothetical protein
VGWLGPWWWVGWVLGGGLVGSLVVGWLGPWWSVKGWVAGGRLRAGSLVVVGYGGIGGRYDLGILDDFWGLG